MALSVASASIVASSAFVSAAVRQALAFRSASHHFARCALALQQHAMFCDPAPDPAPAGSKTAKKSLLAGQDFAPPSPRLRSPYPRQCALAASGLSLSLSLSLFLSHTLSLSLSHALSFSLAGDVFLRRRGAAKPGIASSRPQAGKPVVISAGLKLHHR